MEGVDGLSEGLDAFRDPGIRPAVELEAIEKPLVIIVKISEKCDRISQAPMLKAKRQERSLGAPSQRGGFC